MSDTKKVIIVGASGQLGPHIVSALKDTFTVSILARTGSDHAKYPPSIPIIEADFDSHTSLVVALKDQDAIVSSVGYAALDWQIKLAEAALEAGVKRFIPSEYGFDSENENIQGFPIFGGKQDLRKWLVEKKGEIGWDALYTGPFFEMTMSKAFLGIDLQNRKALIYDSGTHKFNTTRIDDIGTAIRLILQRPPTNGGIRIHSIATSQNELLEIAKELLGESDWEISHTTTAETLEKAKKAFAEGDAWGGISGFIAAGIFGEEFAGTSEVDNERLGLKRLSREELKEEIRKIAKDLGQSV